MFLVTFFAILRWHNSPNCILPNNFNSDYKNIPCRLSEKVKMTNRKRCCTELWGLKNGSKLNFRNFGQPQLHAETCSHPAKRKHRKN